MVEKIVPSDWAGDGLHAADCHDLKLQRKSEDVVVTLNEASYSIDVGMTYVDALTILTQSEVRALMAKAGR